MRYLHTSNRISSSRAKKMILDMACNGDGSKDHNITNVAELEEFYKNQGTTLKKICDSCRDFNESIPLLENLIPHNWMALSGSFSVKQDNDILSTITGPGRISLNPYLSQLEDAISAIKKTIDSDDVSQFQHALILGISSIESYVNEKIDYWNRKNPDQKLIDNKSNKVSFEDKIDKWIPLITGKRLNKGTSIWSNFKEIQKFRDSKIIHQKSDAGTITYSEIADLLNKFRLGIAGLLKELHLIFGSRVPSIVIRAQYAPDITLKSNNVSITIDSATIEKRSNDFLQNSESNPFYDKDVYFTQKLKGYKYVEFQIIGNLGGHPNDYEFNTNTDYFIIGDSLIMDLKDGKKDEQLIDLEKRLNEKGKKYNQLKIISESAFLKHIRKRCEEIGDKVTLNLINLVP